MKDTLALEDIQRILSAKKSYMEQQYMVKEIGVFGSYVQGRQTRHSDVDIIANVNFAYTDIADTIYANGVTHYGQ